MTALLANWKTLLTGGLFLALAIYAAIQAGNAKHYRKAFVNEKAAHAETVLNYRAAAAEATRQAEANVDRVKSEQAKITEEISHDYQARIAAVRARAARLRDNADQGGSGEAGLPAPGDPSGGPDAPAGQDRLPAPDALICTEQAIQLEELQRWVHEQSTVDNEGAAQ